MEKSIKFPYIKLVIVLIICLPVCFLLYYMYGGERSTSKGVVDIQNIDSDFKEAIDMFPELDEILAGEFSYYFRKEPWWESLIAIGKTPLQRKDILLNSNFSEEFSFNEWSSVISISETGFKEQIETIKYQLHFIKSVSRRNIFINVCFDDQGTIILFVKIIRTREIIDKDGNPI